MTKTLCIYPADSMDGFAAATIVRASLGPQNVNLIPSNQTIDDDTTLRDVVLLGVQLSHSTILAMAKAARYILLVESGAEDTEMLELPNNITRITTAKYSLAVRVFYHYNYNSLLPQILLNIQDALFGEYQLPESVKIMAALSNKALNFAMWDKIINGGSEIYLKLLHEGEQILKAEKMARDKSIQEDPRIALLKDAPNKSIQEDPRIALLKDAPNKSIQEDPRIALLKGADNKSESICLEALETVNARVDEYGDAEAVYSTVARLWGAYLADNTGDSSDLSTQDVLVMMMLFNIGREIHAPKRDNRVDIVGYTELLDRLMQ